MESWTKVTSWLNSTPLGYTNPKYISQIAAVSIWSRWLIIAGFVMLVNYKVEYFTVTHVFGNVSVLTVISLNCYAHYRLHAKSIRYSHLLLLSSLDIVCITSAVLFSRWFNHGGFVLYYLAVPLLTMLISSTVRNVLLVSFLGAVYLFCYLLFCTSENDDNIPALLLQILVLYGIALSTHLVFKSERVRNIRSAEREKSLALSQLELSRTIHDTAVQSVYMVGLGIDRIRDLTRGLDDEVSSRLGALSEMARSAMWDLRHPISGGRVLQGDSLTSILRQHITTFRIITSVPVQFDVSGVESVLENSVRSAALSILHNALTNTFRHSGSSQVIVSLVFETDFLRLSIGDDGVGFPENIEEGSGITNMRRQVEQIGGSFAIGIGISGKGAMISVQIPIGEES